MKCCVPLCYTNYREKQHVQTFGFPKDECLRKKWLKFCKMSEKDLKPRFHRVCIHHFQQEDIQRSLQVEMGFGKFKRLQPGAFPSVIVRDLTPSETKRSERLRKKNNKKMIDELLKSYSSRKHEEIPKKDSLNIEKTQIPEPSKIATVQSSPTVFTLQNLLQFGRINTDFVINKSAAMPLKSTGVKYFLIVTKPIPNNRNQSVSLGKTAVLPSAPIQQSAQNQFDDSLEDRLRPDLTECVKNFLIKEEIVDEEFINEHPFPNNKDTLTRCSTLMDSVNPAIVECLEDKTLLFSGKSEAVLHPTPIRQSPQKQCDVSLKEDLSHADLGDCVKDFVIKEEFMDEEFINEYSAPDST